MLAGAGLRSLSRVSAVGGAGNHGDGEEAQGDAIFGSDDAGDIADMLAGGAGDDAVEEGGAEGDDSASEQETDEVSRFRDPPEGFVRLRPSQFRHIPATVFVEYPPELGLKRQDASQLEPLGVRRMCFSSHWERACISNAFRRAGFERQSEASADKDAKDRDKVKWTALWSKHQNDTQMRGLNCLQKVSHFPALGVGLGYESLPIVEA